MATDFVAALVEMRDGEVAMDVNRRFNELLAAVLETGNKGKLTLTVEIKPSKKAIGGAVLEVTTNHACSIKKPELPVGQAFFFVSEDGRLSRDNPAQVAMFETEKEVVQRGN